VVYILTEIQNPAAGTRKVTTALQMAVALSKLVAVRRFYTLLLYAMIASTILCLRYVWIGNKRLGGGMNVTVFWIS